MMGTVIEPRRDPACGAPTDELIQLRARVSELERERHHLVAAVDILHAVSASPHFVDLLQTVARKLGETFGLDRCSIFLAGDSQDVRLVATYEDPALRNLVVDPDRYPALKQAIETGETVVVPDAVTEPLLAAARAALELRNVRSIIVAPIRWRGATIGAILLRTERGAAPFSDGDLRFCQVIASLMARALSDAYRAQARVHGWPRAHHPRPTP